MQRSTLTKYNMKEGTFMKVRTIITDINHDDLVNIFSGYSGYYYWAKLVKNQALYNKTRKTMLDSKKYAEDSICYEDVLAEMILSDKPVELIDKESGKRYTLTKDVIEYGLSLNATKYPKEWDWDCADDFTYDRIIQYAIFGEIVYG